jgi:hypothetical protein
MRDERADELPGEGGTWTTRTITNGDGGADCTGAASGGMAGTWEGAPLDEVATAKLAALTADSAPVRTTAPEMPPVVHEATRRSAWSRSDGRYSAMSAVAATPTAIVTSRWSWSRR